MPRLALNQHWNVKVDGEIICEHDTFLKKSELHSGHIPAKEEIAVKRGTVIKVTGPAVQVGDNYKRVLCATAGCI